MINPEQVAKWQAGQRFDRTAATIIGIIAVLAAVLGVAHTIRSMEGGRAQLESSRLAADISARIGVVSISGNLDYVATEAVLFLRMDGTNRGLTAAQLGDEGGQQVALAEIGAADKLQAALEATKASMGKAPLDAYAIDLVNTTAEGFAAELAEQSRQLDISENAGWHDRMAFLGLSLLALAGVLVGLAAVIKAGRPGWLCLGSAGLLVGVSVLLAVLAIL